MSWRDAFLHPRRNHEGSRPARARARGVGLETFAASELPRDDAGALGFHADPDETIHAEMAVMAHDGLKNLLQVERREECLSHFVKEGEPRDLPSQFNNLVFCAHRVSKQPPEKTVYRPFKPLGGSFQPFCHRGSSVERPEMFVLKHLTLLCEKNKMSVSCLGR